MKPYCLLFVALLWAQAAIPADQPTRVTVTSKIIASEIEPIGANLTTITGGTNFAINNHVWSSGFEPASLRKMVRINRAAENWFEWDGDGGPGYWNLAWSGLFNGATVRFYRIVDSNGLPLDYGGDNDMNNTSGANHVVFLGEARVPLPNAQLPDGGYLVNDDRDGNEQNNMARVFLDRYDLNLRFGDYAYLHHRTLRIGSDASPPDLRQHYSGDRPFFDSGGMEWHGQLVEHPQPLPESFTDHGDSCLHAKFADDGEITLQQYVYYKLDQGEGQWYSQLTPGARYEVSVWLRQQGLGNAGRARFVFNTANDDYRALSQQEPWQVTGDWQQFTYEFTAPEYPQELSHHIGHGLEFTGPGDVWIDNFILYRKDKEHDYKPFGPHANSFDPLMQAMPPTGKKPAIRFYGTIFHDASIASMFTNYPDSGWNVAWNMGYKNASAMSIAQSLQWAYQTGDSPATRAVPYLTCIEEYTEKEWLALIEYLGIPFDPAKDSRDDKPYAWQRYQYRGHGTPWTDEFREIIVEYGNETWHNGAGGYGWHGWGPPDFVHHGGEEYGLFARYMFEQHVMAMPEWKKYNLGNKIKFLLGGNYQANLESETAYGEEAIQRFPQAGYIGHANYVGPKWETADAASDQFNDAGLQETLIARVTGIGKVIDEAAAARDQLAKRGIDYELIAYEGGPSGYWQNKDNELIDELYGKSAAMGLAALDAWLYSSSLRFKHQCYLGFSSGKWWSSHTMPEAGGFRPHVGWLLLEMRNRYAPGDQMLDVEIADSPTLRRGTDEIPLLAAYAIQGDNTLALFLLNRSLDQFIPATIELPIKQAKKTTLHKLTRSDGSPVRPSDNNLKETNVIITSVPLGPLKSNSFPVNSTAGATTNGLPPSSVYLYVFE